MTQHLPPTARWMPDSHRTPAIRHGTVERLLPNPSAPNSASADCLRPSTTPSRANLPCAPESLLAYATLRQRETKQTPTARLARPCHHDMQPSPAYGAETRAADRAPNCLPQLPLNRSRCWLFALNRVPHSGFFCQGGDFQMSPNLPSLRDSQSSTVAYPALKHWANLCRAYGAGASASEQVANLRSIALPRVPTPGCLPGCRRSTSTQKPVSSHHLWRIANSEWRTAALPIHISQHNIDRTDRRHHVRDQPSFAHLR